MALIFCKKCHREAARIIKKDGQTKLMQKNNVLISLSGGGKDNTILVQCPNGHSVPVRL